MRGNPLLHRSVLKKYLLRLDVDSEVVVDEVYAEQYYVRTLSDAMSMTRCHRTGNSCGRAASALGPRNQHHKMLTTLPAELLVKVFQYLHLRDLLAVSEVNHTFLEIVGGSSLLQYSIELEKSQSQDLPSTLNIAEKLRRLQALENGWNTLCDMRKTSVRVVHRPSNIYDLTAGVYILGDRSRFSHRVTMSLRYMDLAAAVEASRDHEIQEDAPTDEREWSEIVVGRRIVDIGLALQEHDLVAVITRMRNPGPHPQYVSHRMASMKFELRGFGPSSSLSHLNVLFIPYEMSDIQISLLLALL